MELQSLLFEISILIRTAVFILAYIITLILLIPFIIHRYIVQVAAKIWSPELGKIVSRLHQLTAHDDFYEDKVAFNIVAWHVMEGSLSVNKLRKMFMENVINFRKADGELEFPEFRQYMVKFGGHLFWKDVEKFDIKNHIRSIHLDSGMKEFSERDLQRTISQLTSQGWARNRGFWEILVINNYTSTRSSGDSVMIFRFHHSLADGYSYLNLLVRRLCRAENMVVAAPGPRTSSTFARLMQDLAISFKMPYDFVRLYAELNHDENQWLLKRQQLRKQYTTVWSTPVEIQLIKAIKRKFGVSFQAVLNSVIGGAIRRLMEREGQDVPEYMTAMSPLPKKHHPGGLSIHVYFTYITIPIRERDPEKRLQLAHSLVLKVVTSTARYMLYNVCCSLGWVPHSFMGGFVDSNHTAMLSSFPGVAGDIYLGGHKIYESNFTVGTFTGCGGVTITTLSCFDVLRFIITIDKGVYPSDDIADAFNGFVREEIQSLLKAVGSLDNEKDVTPLMAT